MTISILMYILGFCICAALVWLSILEHRLKKLFGGSAAKDLEGVMVEISKQMKNLKETQEAINTHLVTVDKRLDQSIRRVETVRFNPFEDAGSNQSFAMSFLNDEGNGVIISSLYARDRMSIFAKPIKAGASEFELSVEEKEVLKKSQ